MRKSLFAGLMVVLTACGPVREIDISWGPAPWYTYCSWDAACWYGPNRVFIYGWGFVDRPTYVLLSANPGRQEGWANRRRAWHPGKRPEYRGRDWDAHKGDHDRGHDKNHDKDRDKDHGDRKR